MAQHASTDWTPVRLLGGTLLVSQLDCSVSWGRCTAGQCADLAGEGTAGAWTFLLGSQAPEGCVLAASRSQTQAFSQSCTLYYSAELYRTYGGVRHSPQCLSDQCQAAARRACARLFSEQLAQHTSLFLPLGEYVTRSQPSLSQTGQAGLRAANCGRTQQWAHQTCGRSAMATLHPSLHLRCQHRPVRSLRCHAVPRVSREGALEMPGAPG